MCSFVLVSFFDMCTGASMADQRVDCGIQEGLLDTVRFTAELCFRGDAEKALKRFVGTKHGTNFPLKWPKGWTFTYWCFDSWSARSKLGVRLVKKKYVCCDACLVSVGVVHRSGVEPARDHPVVFIGDAGNVYLYDGDEDAVYLMSSKGFVGFYEGGLKNYHRLREDLCAENELTSDEVLQLSKASDYDELMILRDRRLGEHSTVMRGNERYATLTVCDSSCVANKTARLAEWCRHARCARMDVVFTFERWIDQRWVVLLTLVDDRGKVFMVDHGDGRAYYIASSLGAFLKVGLMRYRCNYRFTEGCFKKSERENRADGGAGSAYGPTGCSRGAFCGGPSRRWSLIEGAGTAVLSLMRRGTLEGRS